MTNEHTSAEPLNQCHWLELCAFWFFSQVLWGFIPLILTLFFTLAIGLSENITHEFRVAATVVAVTLCGTQFIDDVVIPPTRLGL